MWDILSFNTFITKYVLVFFYYLFAFLAPLVLFLLKDYLLKKYPQLQRYFQGKSKKWTLTIIFLMLFFWELFLRMFFEMLIGYFDMHDYLHTISQILKASE